MEMNQYVFGLPRPTASQQQRLFGAAV